MNWKEELKTQTAYKVFETLMEAGAEMDTVLNIIRINIPEEEQQKKLLDIIEKESIYSPNEMIMAAIEIDEEANPELYI